MLYVRSLYGPWLCKWKFDDKWIHQQASRVFHIRSDQRAHTYMAVCPLSPLYWMGEECLRGPTCISTHNSYTITVTLIRMDLRPCYTEHFLYSVLIIKNRPYFMVHSGLFLCVQFGEWQLHSVKKGGWFYSAHVAFRGRSCEYGEWGTQMLSSLAELFTLHFTLPEQRPCSCEVTTRDMGPLGSGVRVLRCEILSSNDIHFVSDRKLGALVTSTCALILVPPRG